MLMMMMMFPMVNINMKDADADAGLGHAMKHGNNDVDDCSTESVMTLK